jgi:hypothetical protein
MAKLVIKDKVALGKFMFEAAGNPDRLKELEDPVQATKLLGDFLVIPKDTQVVIHLDETDRHHFVLPLKVDLETLTTAINKAESPYAPEYVAEPLVGYDLENNALDRQKAMYFRIGEYMAGRCKT